MSIDDLKAMAESLDPNAGVTAKKAATVLFLLREMDVDDLDRMIASGKMAKLVTPEDLHPAIDYMQSDLILLRTFVEMAKQYDRTEEGMKSFESVFGEITEGKEVIT